MGCCLLNNRSPSYIPIIIQTVPAPVPAPHPALVSVDLFDLNVLVGILSVFILIGNKMIYRGILWSWKYDNQVS